MATFATQATPAPATAPTFKDQHRDIQELAREFSLLRAHNMASGLSQSKLLMFAEGAVLLILLERFLRKILGAVVTSDDGLTNLLEKAIGPRPRLLDPPGGDRQGVIDIVAGIRNSLLHGDFEQTASNAGSSGPLDYFRNHYSLELERLFKIVNAMVRQIDPDTGLRIETTLDRVEARNNFLGLVTRRALKLRPRPIRRK